MILLKVKFVAVTVSIPATKGKHVSELSLDTVAEREWKADGFARAEFHYRQTPGELSLLNGFM